MTTPIRRPAPRSRTRALLAALTVALSAVAASEAHAVDDDEEADGLPVAELERPEPVDFTREILPVLRKNCIACHSSTKARGDVNLESLATLRAGGEDGPIVEPGAPEKSVIFLVASHRERPVMPPRKNKVDASPLTPTELGMLAAWIRQGAQGSDADTTTRVEWSRLPSGLQPVYAVALSEDGRRVVAGRGNRIEIHDLGTGTLEGRLGDPAIEAGHLYGDAPVAHLDWVQSLAVHPDGELIASGGYRTVKLWQLRPGIAAERGRLPDGLGATLATHASGILVSRRSAGGIAVVDLAQPDATRAEIGEGDVIAAAVSPDGERIAFASAQGGFQVAALAAERRSAVASQEVVTALAFAAAGDAIVTGARDGVVRLWTLSGDESAPIEPVELFRLQGAIVSVSRVGDAAIVAATDGGAVRVWSLGDGEALRDVSLGAPLEALAASADGKLLATSDAQRGTRVWSALDGTVERTLPGDDLAARRIERRTRLLKLDERRLEDRTKAREAAKGELAKREEERKKAAEAADKAKTELQAREQALADAEKAGDAKKIEAEKKELEKARSADENARRTLEEADVDIERARETLAKAEEAVGEATASLDPARAAVQAAQEAAAASGGPIRALAFSADGGELLGAGEGTGLARWDVVTGRLTAVAREVSALPRAIVGTSAAQVVVRADGACVELTTAPSWQLVSIIGSAEGDSPFADRIAALDFSPDGRSLVCGGGEPSRGGEAVLYELEDRSAPRLVWRNDTSHSDTILSVRFSADGRLVATGGADKFARVLGAADGREVRFLEGHTGHVLGVTWSADDKWIVSGGADKVLKVWNLETGEAQRTIGGFGKEVTAVSFVGDGNHTISACGDRSIRQHRTDNGQQVRAFGGSQSFVYSLATSRDGKMLAAGGHDGVLRIWSVGDGKEIHAITSQPE